MRHMYRGVVLAALLFGAACANDSTGTGGSSGSGTLILDLTTPHADDGAVLFEVSGPPIDAVAPVNSSLRLFTRRASETTSVGVVVGAVAEGARSRRRGAIHGPDPRSCGPRQRAARVTGGLHADGAPLTALEAPGDGASGNASIL
jgi:hypothetical protein